MKQLYIIVAMLLLGISAFAQDGRSLYTKYSDYDNVEAVYISPAMFRLIGKIPDVEMNDESVNLGPIIKSLSGLYILSIKQGAVADELADDVNRFIKKGQYELLMEAKDSGEVTRMYTVGDDFVVNSFVLLAHDGEETNFICIDGTIPRDKLEQLIADAAKD
ncbi:MAG: DUF4252 domain-containing protein [Bacteroidales bacterium]|nr:DUF4252 domain-containing protein [Bacteroidales bacterium]